MKKVVLALFCAIAALTASAQMFVGGTLGVATQKQTDVDRVTSFAIAPTIGYTINEEWAVGAELVYDYAHQGGVSVNNFNLGPYLRYTFFHNEALSAFAEAGVYYAYTKVKHFDGTNGLGVVFRPGLSYMLNENWQLLAKMNLFSYSHFKGANSTGFAINPTSVSLGIAYNF